MYLCLDVAFRNIGFTIFNINKEFVESGIISSSNLQVTLETFVQKNVKQFKLDSKRYKNETYIQIIQHITEILTEIINTYKVSHVICELPHSGGMDYKSTFQMALSLSFVVTICKLLKINLVPIQPIQSKNLLKSIYNIKKPSKNDSIKFCLDFYPQVKLPKTKGLKHHITDSVLAWHIYILTN